MTAAMLAARAVSINSAPFDTRAINNKAFDIEDSCVDGQPVIVTKRNIVHVIGGAFSIYAFGCAAEWLLQLHNNLN